MACLFYGWPLLRYKVACRCTVKRKILTYTSDVNELERLYTESRKEKVAVEDNKVVLFYVYLGYQKIISDAMYQVLINGYRLVEVSHGRPYYVYCVELFETDSGTRYFSERRYSEFSTLHRALKKDSANIAPFPPKRVRNSQPKVLEQRREALEIYIQKMLKLPVARQQVLNFLGIEGRSSTVSDKRGQKETNDLGRIHSSTIGHRPVLTFHRDPYVQVNKNTSLPDIVTNGVLLGLYKS